MVISLYAPFPMVVCDRSVLELMTVKSSSCNFPEQLSVCAEVIDNCQQIRDCLNVDALEPDMREQLTLFELST